MLHKVVNKNKKAAISTLARRTETDTMQRGKLDIAAYHSEDQARCANHWLPTCLVRECQRTCADVRGLSDNGGPKYDTTVTAAGQDAETGN